MLRPKYVNMKIEKVVSELGLSSLTPCAAVEFDGVYAGDFLSRAMSRVKEGDLWITIMSNINVIAVASLTDAAAVVLAESVDMAEDVLAAAEEKGVAVFSSGMTVFELCARIGAIWDE